ncbi:MAG TPA: PKD domain-containing protein [Polyangiaceae bacterium]|nr:PKD domain-containing protein [Polyangiaceae bacterium]
MRSALLLALLVLAACDDATEPPVVGASSSSSGSGSGGSSMSEPLACDPGSSRYVIVGEEVVLDASGSTGAAQYQWSADNGTPTSAPSASPTATATYDAPGRYRPVLTCIDANGAKRTAQITLTATYPIVFEPNQSSSIVAYGSRAAVVSPDSNEVTLIDENLQVANRIATAARPRSVAVHGERVLVACQEGDVVEILNEGTIALPYGSRPFGIIVVGAEAYVTLQGTGQLARIALDRDPPTVLALHDAGPDPRGLALLPDGRIAVSRWRSPDDQGELRVIDPLSGASELWSLAFDSSPPNDTSSGGVPSYLGPAAVSPIGDVARVPALHANIAQGSFLNGMPLSFESMVRATVSELDVTTGAEGTRIQFDDRGLANAARYSSHGDYLYVTMRGNRSVERVDMFSGALAGSIMNSGYAIEGIALTEQHLFIDAYLSREVLVYDLATAFDTVAVPLATLPIPSSEPLAPNVLLGKQLFNDSQDPRLSKAGYMACAHCHLDGEDDRRTWDFTHLGEGIRNTIALVGRSGGDGPLHWSANFDEMQDFENAIRESFLGLGLMADADFHMGTRDQPLGDPKAGVSTDLDALAAYVSSLSTMPVSPFRDADGQLTSAAVVGRALFESIGCTSCHSGTRLTDSAFLSPGAPLLHDVGTLGPGSGKRLGGPLLGIDTPTLHGLWDSAPYLHDGSAATLEDVLTVKNAGDQHGVTSTLTPTERADLVTYLLSLDGRVD